jgi:hypothetical protein
MGGDCKDCRPGHGALKPNAAVLIKPVHKVRFAKPDTSGALSSELYLLASGFRMV